MCVCVHAHVFKMGKWEIRRKANVVLGNQLFPPQNYVYREPNGHLSVEKTKYPSVSPLAESCKISG